MHIYLFLLLIFSIQSNFTAVKWLVEHKADVALADKAGWTPIFCALNSSDLRSAQVSYITPIYFFSLCVFYYFKSNVLGWDSTSLCIFFLNEISILRKMEESTPKLFRQMDPIHFTTLHVPFQLGFFSILSNLLWFFLFSFLVLIACSAADTERFQYLFNRCIQVYGSG